ncbi:hypothetical protein pdam_00021197 [Pocillopora damicornis]|uniref:Uncharacterized protein n=1 Tax=Pocillopora damicornis TaxID=46731 RepID=A0A3M6TPS4_POCDA|nr:hypothetical protein pdam_00021197 [Pocillopora damicornis]
MYSIPRGILNSFRQHGVAYTLMVVRNYKVRTALKLMCSGCSDGTVIFSFAVIVIAMLFGKYAASFIKTGHTTSSPVKGMVSPENDRKSGSPGFSGFQSLLSTFADTMAESSPSASVGKWMLPSDLNTSISFSSNSRPLLNFSTRSSTPVTIFFAKL